jgi:hypothetical protein
LVAHQPVDSAQRQDRRVLATLQIANAMREHKGKVTVQDLHQKP